MPKHQTNNILDSDIETVFANDINFKGKIRFKKSLKINGTFEGEIDAVDGYLIVGEKANIKADITINKITNYGKIDGNIDANYSIEIFKNAAIHGNIKTSEFFVQKGGIFNGKCSMTFED